MDTVRKYKEREVKTIDSTIFQGMIKQTELLRQLYTWYPNLNIVTIYNLPANEIIYGPFSITHLLKYIPTSI